MPTTWVQFVYLLSNVYVILCVPWAQFHGQVAIGQHLPYKMELFKSSMILMPKAFIGVEIRTFNWNTLAMNTSVGQDWIHLALQLLQVRGMGKSSLDLLSWSYTIRIPADRRYTYCNAMHS